MIKDILVLGAGSAGLLAALSCKQKLPAIQVRVVRSPDIGVIGVGEGTTPLFPDHLFNYVGIRPSIFYARANPTWKLGVHFLRWGPRECFDYSFEHQLDVHWNDLSRANGYYCEEEFSNVNLAAALMAQGNVFARHPKGGGPDIQPWSAFHIENRQFVEVLELVAREAGVEFIDGRMQGAERGPEGIAAILLDDGRRFEADFFIDASGFRSELLGGVLEEPFIRYDRALFCDRAVVGGWERTTEPILPYTIAEGMDAGWAWQIEHEHHVNRGYVYSSQAISDDDAAAEFKRKNPKVPASPRIVKFYSGRHRRSWVDNVLAIGNADGFVEPLEATALMVVCGQCRDFIASLTAGGFMVTPTIRDLYNAMHGERWDEIRDFLAVHYKFNTRGTTPFWQHCREDTQLGGAEAIVEFYRENGPTGLARFLIPSRLMSFGIEGYLVLLVGNRVPYRQRHTASPAEWKLCHERRAAFAAQARAGMNVREALACIRHPGWTWHNDPAPVIKSA
ncbi:MAG TPA: tryptophan 7-halogenase [Chthoniobacteraceae bacterium]|jgi:tryptophan halogenase|nr:tryptophan 7-halogenase [Chthoniobacteraceae bacterium]